MTIDFRILSGATSESSSLNKPSSQEGLKNCPFCGEAPFKSDEGSIACQNEDCAVICGAPSEGFSAGYDPVAAWNTRHPSFNDAIEAAAVMAEQHPSPTLDEPNVFGAAKLIAKAIRSLKLPDYRGGEKNDSDKIAEG